MSLTTRHAVTSERSGGRRLRARAAAGLTIAALTCAAASRLTAQGALFNVSDGRPLAQAIDRFVDRCRCVITYEDPQWTAPDVEDRTALLSRVNPPPARIFVPREKVLTFEDDELPPHPAQAPLRAQVQKAVAEYNRSGAGPAFRVDERDGALHVRPANRSILDTRISLPSTTATTYEALARFISEMNTRGVAMRGGGVPTNFLRQTSVTVSANNEPAGQVLTRLLAATGRHLTWQINYDYGAKSYFLNLKLADPSTCREGAPGTPCVVDLGDTLSGHYYEAPQPDAKPQP